MCGRSAADRDGHSAVVNMVSAGSAKILQNAVERVPTVHPTDENASIHERNQNTQVEKELSREEILHYRKWARMNTQVVCLWKR